MSDESVIILIITTIVIPFLMLIFEYGFIAPAFSDENQDTKQKNSSQESHPYQTTLSYGPAIDVYRKISVFIIGILGSIAGNTAIRLISISYYNPDDASLFQSICAVNLAESDFVFFFNCIIGIILTGIGIFLLDNHLESKQETVLHRLIIALMIGVLIGMGSFIVLFLIFCSFIIYSFIQDSGTTSSNDEH